MKFCLENNSEKLKLAMLSIPQGFMVINPDGEIEIANQPAYRLLAHGREDDLHLQEVLNDIGLTNIILRSSLENGKRSGQFEFRPHDSVMVLKAEWACLVDELNRVIGYSIVISDVTNYISEDKAKNKFLTSISHELRTPIAIIKNSISNILDGVTGNVKGKLRTYLESMDAECHRMSFLVNNLVDMARIESGQMSISRTKVEVSKLIDKVCEGFIKQAKQQKIDLDSQIYEYIPAVNVDERRIEQVLWNLVSNAVKFTPENGNVRVKAWPQGNHMVVVVEDTGPGLTDEQQRVIFNKFHQIGRKAGAGYNGSGLGLSISKWVIEAHGGLIWVESEPGKGSKFFLSLPVFDVNDDSEDVDPIMSILKL